MPEDQPGGPAPTLDQEDVPDLLAYALVRISPPSGVQISREERESNETIENVLWTNLTRGTDEFPYAPLLMLERRCVELLVPRVGIPLKVQIFPRRGSIELAFVIFGAYGLLKDYKPLRDSLMQLRDDIRRFAVPEEWDIVVEDIHTPSNLIPDAPSSRERETVGGLIGMGVASRYAVLYLLILNGLALIFFCYLTLTAVMGNT